MITDARRDFIEDITKPNDIIQFNIKPTSLVSAEIWTCSSRGNVSEARFELLKQCASRLLMQNPGWGFWLLAAHKTLQPDNRIVRHHRLWQSLQKRGTVLPAGKILDQGMRAQDNGVRFFGAIEFKLEQLEAVSAVLKTESAVVVAGDPSQIALVIGQLSTNGWKIAPDSVSVDVINALCPSGGLVLAAFGEFDDNDVALAIMGRHELLRSSG